MYGTGILRGLGITLKHFVDTFTNDLEWLGSRATPETFEIRQGTQSEGVYTVEYPDEKIAVPERFRFVPFLVVNNHDDPHAPGHDWCTSCGICAKVCPPQCIWIVRGTDANTGRPKPEPEAFFIDIDICMNCGYCSEFCPFDAIKMDHDYELASYDRTTNHVFDKSRLSKEVRYWQNIAPTTALEEAIVRGQWEHKDTLKVAKKAGIAMSEPIWENRDAAQHNPDIVAAKQAPRPAAVAPSAGVAAPAAAPASISLDIDGAAPDQLAGWATDEGLPLAARSAAAMRLGDMIRTDKSFKPTSNHRKAVSAAQKAAKAADTTVEEAAQGFTSGQAVTVAPVAPAPVASAPSAPSATPAAPPVTAVSIDVEGANPDQLADWASNDGLPLAARSAAAVRLDGMIRDKAFKPTPVHRKAISAAKKAAADAETSIEDAAAGFTPGVVVTAALVEAATPSTPAAAPVEPAPASEAPASSGGDSGLMTQIEAARELERKGRDKEIKLSSVDRKQIAEAKKAAKEAGIDW